MPPTRRRQPARKVHEGTFPIHPGEDAKGQLPRTARWSCAELRPVRQGSPCGNRLGRDKTGPGAEQQGTLPVERPRAVPPAECLQSTCLLSVGLPHSADPVCELLRHGFPAVVRGGCPVAELEPARGTIGPWPKVVFESVTSFGSLLLVLLIGLRIAAIF